MSSSKQNSMRSRVGKYEVGRVLGEGTFAKVRFAKNVETGQHVAIKVFDKDKILKDQLVQQVFYVVSPVPSLQLRYLAACAHAV